MTHTDTIFPFLSLLSRDKLNLPGFYLQYYIIRIKESEIFRSIGKEVREGWFMLGRPTWSFRPDWVQFQAATLMRPTKKIVAPTAFHTAACT